jgi:hypothetical protein
VAAGDTVVVERLLQRAAGVAASPLARAAVNASKALLAEAGGAYEEAATLYRDAEVGWREWGSVIERAYTLHGLGRCGDEDAAREAAAIFERLRAVPFTAVARAA